MPVRQAVAKPVVGVNEGPAVGRLVLASQVRHMGAQRLSGVRVRRAPNVLQQRVVSEQASAVLCQDREELELDRWKMDLVPGAADCAAVRSITRPCSSTHGSPRPRSARRRFASTRATRGIRLRDRWSSHTAAVVNDAKPRSSLSPKFIRLVTPANGAGIHLADRAAIRRPDQDS